MWQIIKAELHYSRLLLIIAFAAIVLISVLGVSAIEHMDWLPWLPFFLIFSNMNTNIRKEKRNRLLAQLPVPITRVGSSRVALLYLIYFSVVIFWYPPFMQSGQIFEQRNTWVIFAASLMVINVFTAAIIKQDVDASRRKWRLRFWYCAIGYATLLVLLFSLVLSYQGEAAMPAWIAAITDYQIIPIVTLLPVPVLFFVAVFSFGNRQSYLDERTSLCG